MVNRLCIVPRWGAAQDLEWYPWLCEQPVVRDGFGEVLRPNVADVETPTIEAWVESLRAVFGSDRDGLARTYFVGHSVGCQGILHYLASLDAGSCAGLLLVAGWWTVDEPWETIVPWLYTDDAPLFDAAAVKARAGRVRVLISDNDPFTADWQTTQRLFEQRLGATVDVIAGAKHFNATEAPDVATALAGLIADS